jgi:hypothetical protein
VHVVAATDSLAVPGGSETYLLAVVEQLVRFGHRVTIHAQHIGPVSEVAQQLGVAVVGEDELPDNPDGLLVQDVAMAYALGERWPALPQMFVAHSPLFDFQLPPMVQVPGSVVVVLNDRMEALLRGLAADLEVVRLRQPLDMHRMAPRGGASETPRRALLLGNYLYGDARDGLVRAWTEAGLEVVQAGLLAEPTWDPVVTIAEADIVVGKGRAVLEAMSCGRAAFVYDAFGGDGWVTVESYPRLEADGFAGQAEPQVMDAAELRAGLDRYDADMGRVNRELVLKHHSVRRHTATLVELMTSRMPAEQKATSWGEELARVSRLRWHAEAEAVSLRRDVDTLSGRLHRSEADVEAQRGRAEAAEAEAQLLRARVAEQEQAEAARQERRRRRREAREAGEGSP